MFPKLLVPPVRPMRLGALVRLLAAVSVLISPGLSGTAHADADGFLDKFSGTITARYAFRTAATSPYTITPLPAPTQNLKQPFDQSWPSKRDSVCAEIKKNIDFTQWGTCDLQARGELRAKILSPNVLGLKYIVTGNHLQFDAHAPFPLPDPTINVLFDIELDEQISFAGAINGAVTNGSPFDRSSPASVQSAALHFANAQVSTANVFTNLFSSGKLRDAEKKLNSSSAPVPNAADQVGPANAQLNDGARQLGDLLRAFDSHSNWFFNLDITIEQGNLVVQFRRESGLPSKPTGCSYSELVGTTLVHFSCTDYGSPRDSVTLEVQTNAASGSWSNTIYANLTDNLNGYGLGTIRYHVCSSNLYGTACSDPIVVQISFGSGGGASGSTPPTGPACPTSVLRNPCPYVKS